jgi:hypothetical protein
MKVDLQSFKQAVEYIRSINALPVKDLTVINHGQQIEIPTDLIEEWGYIGLNNRDLLMQIDDHHRITKTTTYTCQVVADVGDETIAKETDVEQMRERLFEYIATDIRSIPESDAVKQGDIVLVKNKKDSCWMLAFYVEQEEDGVFKVSTWREAHRGIYWFEQCEPIDRYIDKAGILRPLQSGCGPELIEAFDSIMGDMKAGDVVLVRDEGNPVWLLGYFVRSDNIEHTYLVSEHKDSTDGYWWELCVPFDKRTSDMVVARAINCDPELRQLLADLEQPVHIGDNK